MHSVGVYYVCDVCRSACRLFVIKALHFVSTSHWHFVVQGGLTLAAALTLLK